MLGRFHLEIGETIATVIADEEFIPAGTADVHAQRAALRAYIREDPLFGVSMEPLTVPSSAPSIVREMAEAGRRAGVGPMAAVAGAIAESAVRAMVNAGAGHVIFDNGGDIALYLEEPVTVGIYAGPSGASDFALVISAVDEIVGVCTSSATVGHSISLGTADAAVVISGNVALADAAATALGNAVEAVSIQGVEAGLESLRVDGVDALIVIAGDVIGMRGELPEIIRARIPDDRITRGKEVISCVR